MKRFPLVPTIIVGLAIAIMIGLGCWQLFDRLPMKEAYLKQLAGNPAKPPMAFPRLPDETLLFRQASGFCLQPTAIRQVGAGAAGYRVIADCRTGAEGPGMTVQLGTTRDPKAKLDWKGGAVSGYISHKPTGQSVIGMAFTPTGPKELMLVADAPPLGLAANARPDLSAVPNNHLAYGVQWFAFAAIAGIIYVIAVLRRRPIKPD